MENLKWVFKCINMSSEIVPRHRTLLKSQTLTPTMKLEVLLSRKILFEYEKKVQLKVS